MKAKCPNWPSVNKKMFSPVAFRLADNYKSSIKPLRLFIFFFCTSDSLFFFWFTVFTVGLSLCDEDIPPKASCMSRLSKLYIESLKKLRPSLVSKLCCVTISSSPPTVPFLSSKPSPFLNPWFWWIRVPEAPKLTIGFLKKTSAVNWWGGGYFETLAHMIEIR